MRGGTQAPAARRAGLLRVGIVLAASGPVVLRSFTLGPVDMDGMICWGRSAHVPFLLSRGTASTLLIWAELLLPVIMAGLLLCSSRWTAPLAACAVSAVLAFRLLVAVRAPGAGPFAVRLSLAESPWPSFACYGAAFLLLLAAPRAPRHAAGKELVLWGAAVGAAAWEPLRLSLLLHRDAGGFSGWFALPEPRSVWEFPGLWGCKADADGLLVVLVVLAATAGHVMVDRPRRRVALATGALLVLAALEAYVPVAISADAVTLWREFQLKASMLIRWHLLVAAALVVAVFAVRPATRREAAPTGPP
ncbi:hypothetical protein [Microbispora sp. CA-102843]|uniref:hypothetical protein n=1 Tax=Microbispora sp. CA-102843 TaxID=3239952 RepID=UPI003D8A8D36